MKGERKTVVDVSETTDNMLGLDDVLCTDQIYSGRRAYKRNMSNPKGPNLPGSYDIMLCDDPTLDLAAVAGREAVVCLSNGQLLFREVQQASKPGLYDLHDPFAEPVAVTRDVQLSWAAPLVCGVVGTHWKKMMADGHVQSLKGVLH